MNKLTEIVGDFGKGAYHTSLGLAKDAVDGLISFDYALAPQSEDTKQHYSRIPSTKAGIAGAVTGVGIDLAAFFALAELGYQLVEKTFR